MPQVREADTISSLSRRVWLDWSLSRYRSGAFGGSGDTEGQREVMDLVIGGS